MAITQFLTREDVINSFKLPSSQAVGKIYTDLEPANGVRFWLDPVRSINPSPTKWYGLKNYKGKNWTFQASAQFTIINLLPIQDKRIGWKDGLAVELLAEGLLQMEDAAAAGANFYVFSLPLDAVIKNIDELNNNTGDWSKIDTIIARANQLFPEIAINIRADYDDSNYYDASGNPKSNPTFDLFNDICQDEWGNPARIGYGSGHACFAKETSVNKVKRFVQLALQRYFPILGEKLVWISIPTSAQHEMGFNYENETFLNDGSKTPAMRAIFDYHPQSVVKFKSWVQSRYRTLAEASRVHGINYTSWDQVQPPKTGKASITDTTSADFDVLYRTNLGVDWYLFNSEQQHGFWLQIKEVINQYAPGVGFCGEFGSVSDPLVLYRGTADLNAHNQLFEFLKTQFQSRNFFGQPDYSADYIRSNATNIIQSEINANDVRTMSNYSITDPDQVKSIMYTMMRDVIHNNGEPIFIDRPGSPYYQNTLNLIAQTNEYITNNPNAGVTIGQSITVTLRDMIQNYESVIAAWRAAGATIDYENKVNVKLISNL
jgi:hypothetical protein